MNEFEATAFQRMGNSLPSDAYTQRYSYDAQGRLQYEGWAVAGTSSASAGWAVRRYTYDVDGRMSLTEWAGGRIAFTSAWDNRGALTYA